MNNVYYKQEQIWGKGIHNYQKQVLDTIVNVIPNGVKTILDVGCGDGYITNPLSEKYEVTGMDISEEALKYIKGKGVVGNVTAIPFDDNTFDMVIINDVLEHISEEEYSKALSELVRVSKNYILVTVPNEEDIENKSVVCKQCGEIYHINWHQRTYNKKIMLEMFNGNNCTTQALFYTGDIGLPPHNPLAKWNHVVEANYEWKGAICPKCNMQNEEVQLDKRALYSVRQKYWQQNLLYTNIRSEIMGLYCKTNDEYVSHFKENTNIEQECAQNIDFTNDLQQMDDISEGQRWTRWQAIDGIDVCEKGIRKKEASGNGYFRMYYPLIDIEDKIIINALNLKPQDIRVIAIDPIMESEIELEPEECEEGLVKYQIKKLWNATQFGYQMDIYLVGDSTINSIKYESKKDLETSFWKVEPEFNIYKVEMINKTNVFVTLSVKKQGKIPILLETHTTELESNEKVYSEIVSLYNNSIKDLQGMLKTIGDKVEQLDHQNTLVNNRNNVINELLNQKEMQWEELNRTFAIREAELNRFLNEKEEQRIELSNQLNEKEEQRIELSNQLNEKEEQRIELSNQLNEKEEQNSLIKDQLIKEIEEKNIICNELKESEKIRRLMQTRKVNRILVFSHMFPSTDNVVNGCFVHEQVKALREYEHLDVRVISCKPFWLNGLNLKNLWRANKVYPNYVRESKWVDYEGVPTLYLPYRVGMPLLPFHVHGWTYTDAIMRVIDEVWKEFKFDLIHAHTGYLDGNAAKKVAEKYNVPYVITEHTGPFSILTDKPIVKQRTLNAIKHADRVWAVSDSLRDTIASHYQEESIKQQIEVLYNGVNLEKFTIAGTKTDIKKRANIMFVGYMEPVKNPVSLVKAFKIVHNKYPHARLQLVGDGSIRNEVEKCVNRLELKEYTKFYGLKTREEVAELIQNECDIFVLPSMSETFGVVLIEAMASGKPLVATRCGGPESIIDLTTGLLCNNNDSRDLADKVINIIESYNTYDPDKIRESAMMRFSHKVIADKLSQCYQEI